MSAENKHDLGDLVKVTGTFTDPDNSDAAIDPTVVKLSFRNPAGTVTTWTYGGGEITKVSTGVYTANIDANAAGRWYYRWWSTGTGQAAEEQSFQVVGGKAV